MCWYPITHLTENVKILLCKIIQQMLLEDKECDKTTLSQSMRECKNHQDYFGIFEDVNIHEQYSVYLPLFEQILLNNQPCRKDDCIKMENMENIMLCDSAFLSIFFYLREKYFKAGRALGDFELCTSNLLLYKNFCDTYGNYLNKALEFDKQKTHMMETTLVTNRSSWGAKLACIMKKYSACNRHNRVNSVAENDFIVRNFEDVSSQLEAFIDCYLEMGEELLNNGILTYNEALSYRRKQKAFSMCMIAKQDGVLNMLPAHLLRQTSLFL